MTIRQIAEIAGVSISTVSKIINGKDDNISPATREKVLDIVKKYNYTPYGLGKNNSSKSFIIGILLKREVGMDDFLRGITSVLEQNGYAALVYIHETEQEQERNASILSNQIMDGVIWQPYDTVVEPVNNILHSLEVPVCISCPMEQVSYNNYAIDYKQVGYLASKHLLENKHRQIACFIDEKKSYSSKFFDGYKKALLEYGAPISNQMCYKSMDSTNNEIEDIFTHGITGTVCMCMSDVAKLYTLANRYNYQIPRDLSIVTLDYNNSSVLLDPHVSRININYYDLGQKCSKFLINKMEKGSEQPLDYSIQHNVQGNSVDVPITVRGKKLLVIGTMNIDTIVNVDNMPRTGETIAVKNRVQMAGGKGVNQAIGAAKLGAEVYLIGCIGKDFEGSLLHKTLHAENVHTQGVKVDTINSTGSAYIYVEPDGESGILIYEGANASLSSNDIVENSDLFDHCSYCLLQTEIRMNAVERVLMLAKQKNVKTIMKPSVISAMKDSFYKMIDIFVPNRKELNRLCPQYNTIEEKVDFLLSMGVPQIIVTLDKDGCFYKDNQGKSFYCKAADFQAVDTTGAADAFIATLAVFLSEGHKIENSIKYATYAAGFSITRRGVPSALVDRATIDLVIDKLE